MIFSTHKTLRALFLVILLCQVNPVPAQALEPDEVAVIANTSAKGSLNLAKYYMRQRQIPPAHLIEVKTTWKEHCSRGEYDRQIRQPVRKALDRLAGKAHIRCLVTLYGVPLAIRTEDDPEIGKLQRKLQSLEEMTRRKHVKRDPEAIAKEKEAIEKQLKERRQKNAYSSAAVDSELALVLTDSYPLEGWLINPYFLGASKERTPLERDKVLLVSRLDGPNESIVKRLIDDAIQTEKKGLRGRAYFDARFPRPEAAKPIADHTAVYDASLYTAADKLRESGRMEAVVMEESGELFPPGSCPEAALYNGWYSLTRYVDAFAWVPGSVGYHIASGECATLREKKFQGWCKRMLEQGITATIGPVSEPYLESFPPPELFFATLSEGYLTLGETYLVTLPWLSWQIILIGDPLYKPFSPRPQAAP